MRCSVFWSSALVFLFFFFKQKTAYEMRISDWSSDVCSSDLALGSGVAGDLPEHDGRARPHHGRKALQGSDGDGRLTGVKVETHALCDQCGGCNDRPHGGGEHVEKNDVQNRAKLAGANVGKTEADSKRRPRPGSRCHHNHRRRPKLKRKKRVLGKEGAGT